MTIAAILAVLAAASPLQAGGDDCTVPMANWKPRSAVQQMAEANGWTVRRIKIDDGCYEIVAYDAQGRPIEVHVDPATLELIEIEYEDDDAETHHDDDNHRGGDHSDEAGDDHD